MMEFWIGLNGRTVETNGGSTDNKFRSSIVSLSTTHMNRQGVRTRSTIKPKIHSTFFQLMSGLLFKLHTHTQGSGSE